LNVCPTTDILSLLYSVSVLITKSIVFFTALWVWPLEKFLYSMALSCVRDVAVFAGKSVFS